MKQLPFLIICLLIGSLNQNLLASSQPAMTAAQRAQTTQAGPAQVLTEPQMLDLLKKTWSMIIPQGKTLEDAEWKHNGLLKDSQAKANFKQMIERLKGDAPRFLNQYPFLVEASPDTDMVEFLVKHGAPVNQQDANGYTALHKIFAATVLRFPELAERCTRLITNLLAAGASPFIKNIHHKTFYDLANHVADHYKNQIPKKIVDDFVNKMRTEKTSANLQAKEVTEAEMLDLLKKTWSTIIHPPLGSEAEKRLKMVKLFDESPAKTNFMQMIVNLKNKAAGLLKQYPFLVEASPDVPMVAFLIKHGAPINQQDSNGDTALHKTLVGNDFSITLHLRPNLIKFLLESGADPFIKNKKNRSFSDYAYHYALKLHNYVPQKLLDAAVANKQANIKAMQEG